MDSLGIQNILAIIFIIIFSLILIYIVVKLIGSLILGISNMRLKLHENDSIKRERDIKLQDKISNLGYILPTADGILPVPRSALEDVDTLAFTKEQIISKRKPNSVILPPNISGGQQVSVGGIPDFFSLWQNDKLPKEGKILLGFNAANGEPVVSSFGEMYSTLIGGQPRSGKSTFVRFLIVQALLQGGKFVVIDPHVDAGQDSLAGSFEVINSKLYAPIARSTQDQLNLIELVKQEIKDRLSGKKKADFDLIFITDETGQMLSDPNTGKPLEELLGIIVNQAGKARVYAISIGQNFHSRIVSTVVRNSYISIVSTYSRKEVARMLSGDQNFAELAETLQVGQIVLYKRHESMIINVPNVTSRHVALIAMEKQMSASGKVIDAEYSVIPNAQSRKEEERYPLRKEWVDEPEDDATSSPSGSGQVVDSRGFSAPLPAHLKADKLEKILEMMNEMKSATQIIKEVWKVDSKGDAFQKAAVEYRQYLAYIAKGFKQ